MPLIKSIRILQINKSTSKFFLFSEVCKDLVQPVMSGFNGTIFAYGPTGTGKTYTMLGDKEKNVPGVSVLIIQDILNLIEQDQENQYNLMVSYVEIYNENIRDLLVPPTPGMYLDLRDDPEKGIQIANVTEIKVESGD